MNWDTVKALMRKISKKQGKHRSSCIMDPVVMLGGYQVNSLSSIGVLPFIEGSLRDGSGLVAVSRDSEEHA